jgi:hypothetical protein
LRSWSISFWKLLPFLGFGADVIFVLESTVEAAELGREKQTKKLNFISFQPFKAQQLLYKPTCLIIMGIKPLGWFGRNQSPVR